MATFQGFELISNFSAVFTFLLTFSIVYGVLAVTNIFGDKNSKTLAPIFAFSISILASFSPIFVNIISAMAPWFITIIIAFFFVLLFLRFLGVNDDMFENFFSGDVKEKTTLIYWVIVIVLVVVVLTVSLQIGDAVGPYVGGEQNNVSLDDTSLDIPSSSGDSFAENLGAAIFHPNVVGAFMIMLIASLAIRQLSQENY